METPKSQITVENHGQKMLEPTKKDNPHPKAKKKPQGDDKRGTITIKSNPKHTGGQPTNWKMVIPQKFSHRSETSELYIGLLSLGVWEREE